MWDQIVGWIQKLTEAGVSLLALSIVVQVLFGKALTHSVMAPAKCIYLGKLHIPLI